MSRAFAMPRSPGWWHWAQFVSSQARGRLASGWEASAGSGSFGRLAGGRRTGWPPEQTPKQRPVLGIGGAVVVQIPVAAIAVTIGVGVALGRIGHQRAVVAVIGHPIGILVSGAAFERRENCCQ